MRARTVTPLALVCLLVAAGVANVWQTSIKRVALVLLAAAVIAPAALGNTGQPIAGNSHLADLTAMAKGNRAQTSTNAPTTAGNSHLQDLTAMSNGSQVSPATATSSSFSWGDAGIGATSGFAAAIALAATLLFVLRRRPRGPGRGTPTTA
jgi:hypothetical protein